jgi:hypothetical protein
MLLVSTREVAPLSSLYENADAKLIFNGHMEP